MSISSAATGRARTYEWSDPASVLVELQTLSGHQALRAMSEGRLPFPPIAATLAFDSFDLADDGGVVVTLTPEEFHYNPLGVVHGGILATLLDTVCGCSVHATLPAGVLYTSLDLAVKFLRPVTIDSGRIECRGHVVHRGSRTALAHGEITDGQGRLLATATSSCLIFS